MRIYSCNEMKSFDENVCISSVPTLSAQVLESEATSLSDLHLPIDGSTPSRFMIDLIYS